MTPTNQAQESRRILLIGLVFLLAAAVLCAGAASHLFSWISGPEEAVYIGDELPESARDDLLRRNLIAEDDEVLAVFHVRPMRSLFKGSVVTTEEVFSFTESDNYAATVVRRLPLQDIVADQSYEPSTHGTSPELVVRAADGESVTLRLPGAVDDSRRFLEVLESAAERR